jgi:hypothetical protein
METDCEKCRSRKASVLQSGRALCALCAMNYYEARGCTGKIKLSTRAQAEALADRKRKEWRLTAGETLNVYLCQFCRSYHLGRNKEES